MSCFLRSILVLSAMFAAAETQAAGKAAHSSHARHTSHTKTHRYRRPAVHRHPAARRHRVTRAVRRPRTRTVVRTVRRYPVHRVIRRYVYRPYYYHRHHRRYAYFYYPGRYYWRTNYYNRGYGRSRQQFTRGIRGIVEAVQGNPGNGTLLVKVLRSPSSRFRYAATVTGAAAGRGASSVHRFHVNNATRYEILSTPPTAGTFASLHKGEQVLILRQGNQSNNAQKIEVFPWRNR